MNPLTHSKNTTILPLLIALVLVCFGLSPATRAVVPPPDGGYPGFNTAEGHDALLSLTTGEQNTAIGFQALYINTTGDSNTATGAQALHSNETGDNNTATGAEALDNNESGSGNTANGVQALFLNETGDDNTASGRFALFSNTTGDNNTANGFAALNSNTTGSRNIALGFGAGEALTTGSDNIDIGNFGIAGESNTIRIGRQGTQTATFIAGISETPIRGGEVVRVNQNGQLGTTPSSVRFKQNIKPMDKASEAIHALKPVTFHYKKELDPEGIPQFGLVAEEVEKVNPALVARDNEGKVYTVRYEAGNAMLLNEFLKEHRKVQEQDVTIAQLKKDFQATIARQQKQIEALTAGLQKVSAQVEMGRPGPRVVVKN